MAAFVVVALMPALAFAGAPDPETRETQLLHRCQSGPLAGEVCDPTGTDCGTKSNGEPYPCVPDLLKRPVLRGTLTVIFDENPADNVSLPGNPAITALLEIKLKGQRYLFTKSFQSSTPGNWPQVGGWNAPTSEADIASLAFSWPFQQPLLALTPFKGAIDQAVEEAWPGLFDLTGRVPLITDAVLALNPDKVTDQYSGEDLGRVIRLKVRIQYVAPAVV
jgi:hypothetical protein